MRRLLTIALLVTLVFVLSACATDPLIEIICKPDFDYERCLQEESK